MNIIEQQIEDYLHYCRVVRQMTETTLRQKSCILGYFVRVTGVRELNDVTDEIFEWWVEYVLGIGVSSRTANMYNSIVVAMVRYYRELGVKVPINLNLVTKLKETASERQYYSRSEIMRVVEVAEREVGLMIRIMFETGMRIAEVVGLRVEDFEGRRIRFVGKGRKMREVYITTETLGMVDEYRIEYGIMGYLWSVNDGVLTCNGEPPTVNTVRKWLREAFAAAGFEGFYPHALRHSFATDLQIRGASVMEIKEMIGHESVATTERYLHGFDGRMRELFDKYR